MPAYFFHLIGDDPPLIDVTGINLPDIEAARMNAVFEAREIMKAGLFEGCLPLHLRFDVTDQAGRLLLSLPFDKAVRLPPPASAAEAPVAAPPHRPAPPAGRWTPWLVAPVAAVTGWLAAHLAGLPPMVDLAIATTGYDLALAMVVASLAWLRTSLMRY